MKCSKEKDVHPCAQGEAHKHHWNKHSKYEHTYSDEAHS